MFRIARVTLLILQAFVAVTALAGGVVLVLGSTNPDLGSVLVPPDAYLAGSPFASYLVPGLLLIVGVAGVHAAAFVTVLVSSRWAMPLSAAAGFGCLIWIFVQMIYIPFSALQAVYFALGLAELAFAMVLLGVVDAVLTPHRTSYLPVGGWRMPHARHSRS
ncbi:MAG: hypothetical protein ACTHNQ_15150 [Microbacterium sp.]|uniref:hypothetical protein n=1 Tax=Microbacterium sp. TaxID=51671 RepID=UPI003F7CEAB8